MKFIIISIILLINSSGHTKAKGGFTAIDDLFTVPENQIPAAEIFVLQNDLAINKATTIVSVTQPANGTVVIVDGSVSYLPDTNYCNSNSGITDDFTYSISDVPPAIESTATVRVTVTCSGVPIQTPQTVPTTNWYSLIVMMTLLVIVRFTNRG